MGSPHAAKLAAQLRASLTPEQRGRWDASNDALLQASGKMPNEPGYVESLQQMAAIEKMLIHPEERAKFTDLADLQEYGAPENDFSDEDFHREQPHLAQIYGTSNPAAVKPAQSFVKPPNSPAVVRNPPAVPYKPPTMQQIAKQRLEKMAAQIPTEQPTLGPVIRRSQDRKPQWTDAFDLPDDPNPTGAR